MFGDTIDIGPYSLIPGNSYDDFITRKHWAGTTGKDELSFENKGISVYPNPASGRITVSLPSTYNLLYYELIDRSGQKILKENITNTKPDVTSVHFDETSVHACQFNINISNIPTGIYLINVYTSDKVLSQRVIIHHSG